MSDDNRDQWNPPQKAECLAGGFHGRVSVGEERTRVELKVGLLGEDWLMLVTGGKAHVGAVATAVGAEIQLSVVGSHQEGPLAEICASQWSVLTGKVCVAVVGIHQDQATRNEINDIVDHVRQGLEILSSRWKETLCAGKDDDSMV